MQAVCCTSGRATATRCCLRLWERELGERVEWWERTHRETRASWEWVEWERKDHTKWWGIIKDVLTADEELLREWERVPEKGLAPCLEEDMFAEDAAPDAVVDCVSGDKPTELAPHNRLTASVKARISPRISELSADNFSICKDSRSDFLLHSITCCMVRKDDMVRIMDEFKWELESGSLHIVILDFVSVKIQLVTPRLPLVHLMTALLLLRCPQGNDGESPFHTPQVSTTFCGVFVAVALPALVFLLPKSTPSIPGALVELAEADML